MPNTWLDPYPQRLRMLLAEAGYPDAHVYVENGIFIEGVPDEVTERAFDIANGAQTPPLCRCCYSRRTVGKPTCRPCYDECTNEGCVIGAAADLPVQGEPPA